MLGYLCFAQTLLCSKNKDKKSESNSQLTGSQAAQKYGCVRRTKIKNLKAIHNSTYLSTRKSELCSKNKDKKSESNSQPVKELRAKDISCVRRTKIKNLKAIHNLR